MKDVIPERYKIWENIMNDEERITQFTLYRKLSAKKFKEEVADFREIAHLACSNYPNCNTEGCGEF